jgi:hypothetical protein
VNAQMQAIHFASRGVISANILCLVWFIFFMFALYDVVSLCFKQRSNARFTRSKFCSDYVTSFEGLDDEFHWKTKY